MLMRYFRAYGIYIIFILLFVFFACASKAFLSMPNLMNVARQVSMLGIAAVGMTFVLILAGIDLSIGSQVTMANVVGAWLMVHGKLPPAAACALVLVMTVLVGFFNGWVVANIKVPPLIVTMAAMTSLEGAAFIISGGVPIFGFPKGFSYLGQGYVGPIPVPVIVMVVVLAIGAFILNKTYFGRHFYAVGGNEEASLLSGINVNRIKYLAYSLSGLFAGIAGIVMLSRTNSGQPVAGKGFEFDVLIAVVLGGVSVNGGVGRISHVVAGVLIIGILTNGLVLMNVNSYVQMVIKGIVLLLAVSFDCIQKSRAAAKG